MKVWAVRVNADMTEGRGPMVICQLFENKDQADEWAMSQEPYGYVNQFTKVESMQVLDFDAANELLELNSKRGQLKAKRRELEAELKEIDKQIRGLDS